GPCTDSTSRAAAHESQQGHAGTAAGLIARTGAGGYAAPAIVGAACHQVIRSGAQRVGVLQQVSVKREIRRIGQHVESADPLSEQSPLQLSGPCFGILRACPVAGGSLPESLHVGARERVAVLVLVLVLVVLGRLGAGGVLGRLGRLGAGGGLGGGRLAAGRGGGVSGGPGAGGAWRLGARRVLAC